MAAPQKKKESQQMAMDIIPVADIPKNWTFEYNCRNPARSSKAYKDMRHTLAEEPAKFNDFNCGIHVANKKYILDGGHTYMAIQDARNEGIDISLAQVKVFYYEGLSNRDMAEKSKYLNNKVTPPLSGEKDLLGVYDTMKVLLDKKYDDVFEFRPNTKPKAAYDVKFLIAILNALTAATGELSYSGKGVLNRLYTEDKYALELKLLNDAIELYGTVYHDLAANKQVQKMDAVKVGKVTRLPNGTESDVYIPEGYVWPVFASFKTLVSSDGEWKEDPTKLWNKQKKHLINQLLLSYRNNGKNPTKLGKDKEAYLFMQVALRT
jgi:hypothetical protein